MGGRVWGVGGEFTHYSPPSPFSPFPIPQDVSFVIIKGKLISVGRWPMIAYAIVIGFCQYSSGGIGQDYLKG